MVKTRKLLFLLVVLVLTISVIMSMAVFAESNNTILNFNQYIANDYINHTVDSYFGNAMPLGQYFIRINSNINTSILFVYSGGRYYSKSITIGENAFIIYLDNNINAIQFNNPITYTGLNAINLTQMYGAGNEPTLEECKSIFTTIYSYTTSNLITSNNLDYNDGYNDGFKNGQSSNYNLVFQNSLDNITGVNAVLNSSYDSDGSIIYSSSSNFILTSFVNFSNFAKNSRYNITWDEITVLSPSNYSGIISFEFVQPDGSYDSYDVDSNINGSLSFFNSATGFTSFGLSFSSDVSSFKVKNLKVYLSNDVQESYDQGYNNGYADGNRNGELNGYNKGYDVGYNKGTQLVNNEYNKGYNDGVKFVSDNNFVTLFSSVIEAPVNAILKMFDFEVLGYNMKAFLVGLFSVALTLAIIRLFL